MTQPPPERAALVAAARSMGPTLRSRAAQSEADRRVSSESIAEMSEAGLFQILTPATHAGLEAGLRAQVETLFEVAAADPAAGWVQMVSNAHAWVAGNFAGECQAAVFGNERDVIPGTLAAQGKATAIEGGWSLNGRWQFASGIDHGDWVMLGARAPRSDTNPGGPIHVIVPKADIEVDDTWHVLGLRGTGSKDLVAEDVFVPAAFAMSTPTLFDGMSPHGEAHETHLNRLPVLVCLSTQLAAAVVGIGAGAYDSYVQRTRDRREVYTGAAKATKVGTQMRVAESKVELELARQLVTSAAQRCDGVGTSGERLTIDERVELRCHAAYAVELVRRSIDRMFAASGAHGVYDGSELQARYRDVNTACHHAIIDIDDTFEIYGRTLLGLDPESPLV